MNKGLKFARNFRLRIINLVIQFMLVMLSGRLLSIEDFGRFSLLIANISFFNLLSSFGTDPAITYYTASGSIKLRKIIGIACIITLLQVVFLLLTEHIYTLVTGRNGLLSQGYLSHAILVYLLLLLIALNDRVSSIYNGGGSYHYYSASVIVSQFIQLVVLGYLYLSYRNAPLEQVLAVSCGAYLLQLLLPVLHMKKLQLPVSTGDAGPVKLRSFIFFSALLFITNLIQFVAFRIDLWYIEWYATEKELGWYGIVLKLLQLLWILPSLSALLIYPMVADKTQQWKPERLKTVLRCMTLVNMLLLPVILFLLPVFVDICFGDAYAPAVSAFRIILPGGMLFSLTTIIASYFAGEKKIFINFFGSLICCLSIWALDAFLVPLYGMYGAAIASSSGYILTTIYFVTVLAYRSGIKVTDLLVPGKSDIGLVKQQVLKLIFPKNN